MWLAPMPLKSDHLGERLLHPGVRPALPKCDIEATEISSAQLNQTREDQFEPDGLESGTDCLAGSLFEFKEPSTSGE